MAISFVSNPIVPTPTTNLTSWQNNHTRERMCMIGVVGDDRLYVLGNNKIYKSTTADPLNYELSYDFGAVAPEVLLYNINTELLYVIKDNADGNFTFYIINPSTSPAVLQDTKTVSTIVGIGSRWNWVMCEDGYIAGTFSTGTNLYFTRFDSESIPLTATLSSIKVLTGAVSTPPSIYSIGNYIHILNLEYDGGVKKPKYYKKTISPDAWVIDGANAHNSVPIGSQLTSVEDNGMFHARVLADTAGRAYVFFYDPFIFNYSGGFTLQYSGYLYYNVYNNTNWSFVEPTALYGNIANYNTEPAVFSVNKDEDKLFVAIKVSDPTNKYIRVKYINIPSGAGFAGDVIASFKPSGSTNIQNFSAPFKYINKSVTDIGFINTDAVDPLSLRIARDGSIVPNLPPGPITNLNVTTDAGLVTLSWTKPVDADLAGYEITRTVVRDDTGHATGDVIDLEDPIAISYEDTDVVNGSSTSATGTVYVVEYNYSIKAVDASGLKSTAVTINTLPKNKIPDGIVTSPLPTITAGDGELTLVFKTPASGVAGVLIVRGEGDTSLNPVEGTEYDAGDYLDVTDINSLVVYRDAASVDETITFVDNTYSIENNHTYIYKIYVYDAESSPVGPAYSLYYRMTGTPLGAPVIVSTIPRNAYQIDVLFDQAMKADSDLFSYSNYKLVISGDPGEVTQLNVNVGIVLSEDKKTVTLVTKEQDPVNTYILTVNPTS